MTVPTTTRAKANKIIDAASDQIFNVVMSICSDPAPAGYTYNPDWADRYEAVSNLNVLTPTEQDGLDLLSARSEMTDRFPSIAFFIDEIMRQPESEELVTASLGVRIETMGETFAIAQYEMHEIYHAIRAILALDKSLGHATGRGGVVDWNQWTSMQHLLFTVDEMRRPVVAASFFFTVKYRDVIYT